MFFNNCMNINKIYDDIITDMTFQHACTHTHTHAHSSNIFERHESVLLQKGAFMSFVRCEIRVHSRV